MARDLRLATCDGNALSRALRVSNKQEGGSQSSIAEKEDVSQLGKRIQAQAQTLGPARTHAIQRDPITNMVNHCAAEVLHNHSDTCIGSSLLLICLAS